MIGDSRIGSTGDRGSSRFRKSVQINYDHTASIDAKIIAGTLQE